MYSFVKKKYDLNKQNKKTKCKQNKKTKCKQNKKTKCKQNKKTKCKQNKKIKYKQNKKIKCKQTKKINKFKGGVLKIKDDHRQKLFLQKLCPNNNTCLVLGQYTDIINAYFDNINLTHAVNPITAVGESSNNGFIRRIQLTKNNYSTITMLKSAKSKTSDNLMYEYLVGLFINKYTLIFPCFLQTYACYQYKDDAQYTKFADNLQSANDLKSLPQLYSSSTQKRNQQTVETLVNQSCDNSKHICLLTQYFENPIGLKELLNRRSKDEYFCRVELIQILLQIYIPLGMMETAFTHNDLHINNVLIYEIPDGQYVSMNYKTPFGDVSLKTRYICKIIDYGRSYFKDDRMSSENVRKTLCENVKCGSECDKSVICRDGLMMSECGIDSGYSFVDTNLDSYHMSSIINNPGKDLWLIQIIDNNYVQYMSHSKMSVKVRLLFAKVVKDSFGVNYAKMHATTDPNNYKIYSVKYFMKKAIECFNDTGVSVNINALQSAELDDVKKYGTITIDAVTNADYKIELNYE
jgi:hypothetical protein